jgi:hypothetical protein
LVSVLLWPCAIGTSDSADNNAVADAAKIVIPLFFIGISLTPSGSGAFAGRALAWLLVSFYLATGPSPLGARWIQEHFVLFGAQETNSYVGPCNRLAFNVGLHNENNDFTGVPWHRLPDYGAGPASSTPTSRWCALTWRCAGASSRTRRCRSAAAWSDLAAEAGDEPSPHPSGGGAVQTFGRVICGRN